MQRERERGFLFLGEKLHDRRFPFAVFHFDEREPFRAVLLRHRRDLFRLAGRDPGKAFRVDRFDGSASIQRAAKHFETARGENIAQIRQLHPETAIRLIAAKLVHRFAVGQPWKRRRNFDPARRAKDRSQHSFDERENIRRLDERCFNVDLREFRLAIRAQIFVAETFRDLEILLDPAHHEELLVLLRRLRERVKFARRETARHEEIPCAFRRALGKNRRLDFHEPLLVEVIACRLRDLVPLAEVAREMRPAQIEIAIAQPQIFVARIGIERKRQNVRAIQNAETPRDNFDRTRGQLRIFRPRHPRRDRAFDFDYIFVPQSVRDLRQLRVLFWTKYHLRQSLTIAEVDEDHAAVIAPHMHPTRKFGGRTDIRGA